MALVAALRDSQDHDHLRNMSRSGQRYQVVDMPAAIAVTAEAEADVADCLPTGGDNAAPPARKRR